MNNATISVGALVTWGSGAPLAIVDKVCEVYDVDMGLDNVPGAKVTLVYDGKGACGYCFVAGTTAEIPLRALRLVE
jgi:hypothetical protein